MTSQDGAATSALPEVEEAEGDWPAEEGGHNVYQNRESVYSVFRQTAPQLDGVQAYLVDRLASERLFADFKVG